MKENQIIVRMQELANELKEKYNYSSLRIAQHINKEEVIPITVFSTEMSPLRALVCFLRQEGMTNRKISNKVRRSYRSVWGVKTKKRIDPTPTKIFIPLAKFNKDESILETVVSFLKEKKDLRFSEIADILNKGSKDCVDCL